MANEKKEQIRRQVLENSLVFFEKYGLKIKQAPTQKNVVGHCPFHDDQKPSFSLNIETGLWKCFAGCGSGDLFSFYAKSKGYDCRSQFNQILVEIHSDLFGGDCV